MRAANATLHTILRDRETSLEPAQRRQYFDHSRRALHTVEFGYLARGGQRVPEAVQLAVKLRVLESVATLGVGPDPEALSDAVVSAHDAEVEEAAHRLKVRDEAVERHGATSNPAVTGRSWRPVDLTDTVASIRDGTITPPTPTIGAVTDAPALFYLGAVNGLAGASNGGKSLTAKAVARQQLDAGEHVVFIDLEDTAEAVAAMMLDLGADTTTLAERFHYVRPLEGYTDAAHREMKELIDDMQPNLVIFDSTGEGLALDGVNPNADEEVAAWFRRVPATLADLGPAVVLIDHMTKADDGGLWPIGSQRKRAAISGAQYVLKPGRTFARGQAGHAYLVTAKDRHGHHRQGDRAAELRVTPDTDNTPIVELCAPGTTSDPGGEGWRPTALMERASRALEANDAPMSVRELHDAVGGKRAHRDAAIRALVTENYVTTTDGPRRAILHASAKPYRQREDPRSDVFTGTETPGAHSEPETTSEPPVTAPVPLRWGTGAQSHKRAPDTVRAQSGHSRNATLCRGCGSLIKGTGTATGYHPTCEPDGPEPGSHIHATTQEANDATH